MLMTTETPVLPLARRAIGSPIWKTIATSSMVFTKANTFDSLMNTKLKDSLGLGTSGNEDKKL